jgi:transposase-like protein
MTAPKRCPRCGQHKVVAQFYRRRGGRRLSPYCQPCSRAAARATQTRRRQNPTAAEQLRTVDRARQHRRRVLGRQEGEGR